MIFLFTLPTNKTILKTQSKNSKPNGVAGSQAEFQAREMKQAESVGNDWVILRKKYI